ncbi:carph-isopro domain-containing protein [Methylobacterium sp. J-030]|uniref:carph-isopro domain-containing protein n=1 Tax=Methylobacterium sp. J-030 TaxID=2836627 RepID=UPI00391D5AC0
MESARQIVDAFGNAQLAAALDVPVGTVSAWKSRGAIPHAYWRKIEAEARKRKIKSISYDLLERISPTRKPRSKHATAIAEHAR